MPRAVSFLGLGPMASVGIDRFVEIVISPIKYKFTPRHGDAWLRGVLATPDTFWRLVYAWDPQWAKTSERIVFRATTTAGDSQDIWVVELETGAVTNLTYDPGRDYAAPAYSPDDSEIVMTSRAGGATTTIHVMDASGGNLRDLGGNGRLGRGPHNFPAWR